MGIKPELSVYPYCGRPFEQRYLYTSGGPGLFLSRGRRVSWPALLPPTVLAIAFVGSRIVYFLYEQQNQDEDKDDPAP